MRLCIPDGVLGIGVLGIGVLGIGVLGNFGVLGSFVCLGVATVYVLEGHCLLACRQGIAFLSPVDSPDVFSLT